MKASIDDPRFAMAAGVILGLLVSAIVITIQNSTGLEGPLLRPDGVPEQAVWLNDAFGQPRWVYCAPDQDRVVCTAYSRGGTQILSAGYVPLGKKSAPAPPFDHVVAREVDRIWVNKIAMVPDGRVEFPAAKENIDYTDGKRLTDPSR